METQGRVMSEHRHVIIEDELLAAGFTQIPNLLLRRPDIAAGAKVVYMLLLSYAWQDQQTYPGQDRLAADMGATERSVITHLKQLRDAGLISIRRRGRGQTNIYTIHRLTGPAKSSEKSRSEKSSLLARTEKSSSLEVKNLHPTNTQLTKTQNNRKTNVEDSKIRPDEIDPAFAEVASLAHRFRMGEDLNAEELARLRTEPIGRAAIREAERRLS